MKTNKILQLEDFKHESIISFQFYDRKYINYTIDSIDEQLQLIHLSCQDKDPFILFFSDFREQNVKLCKSLTQ